MRPKKPSPAMVVAIIALVMASTGSAVAAVNFARNAGAVDDISAVKANASTERAAGKLVATRKEGKPNEGQIPRKFLAGVPYGDSFSLPFPVVDNATGAPVTLVTSELGSLTASCGDQAGAVGVEDPTTTVTFSNTSGFDVNVYRRVGVGDQQIVTLVNGTQESFTINNQNNFRVHMESLLRNVVIDGVVRQLSPRTGDASCAVFGVQQQID